MPSPRTSSSGNKLKAEERYKSAALNLQNVMPKETCRRLGDITFAEFDAIHGSGKRAKALGDALENLIQARSEVGKKKEAKKGIGDIVISCFRASYPFANLLIRMLKEGSQVKEKWENYANSLLDIDSQSLRPSLWRIACFNGGNKR